MLICIYFGSLEALRSMFLYRSNAKRMDKIVIGVLHRTLQDEGLHQYEFLTILPDKDQPFYKPDCYIYDKDVPVNEVMVILRAASCMASESLV